MRRLTRDEARRIAIRAQLLDARRPRDLVAVVDRLTFLQLDPTDAVAPSADLVAWTRLGTAYEPVHLQQALERDRTLFEHRAMVRPMMNLGLYLADMAAWPFGNAQRLEWLSANDAFRRRVLDLLGTSGPLPSRDIPDSADVPWPSTGWTNNRNVTQMLEFLVARGEVAVAGRRGRQRLWDLAERVYPVEVDGTSGVWRVDPEATAEDFDGRTALLSPFDRLIHDRVRAKELFDFEFYLEMYKPKDKRRWGYFALPVLHHDDLLGKVDATADRKTSLLQVHAVHPRRTLHPRHDRRGPRRTGGAGAVAGSRRPPLRMTRTDPWTRPAALPLRGSAMGAGYPAAQ